MSDSDCESANLRCENNRCLRICAVDDDCPLGEPECVIATGTSSGLCRQCRPGADMCPAGQLCNDNYTCVSCLDNADCGDDEICWGGECRFAEGDLLINDGALALAGLEAGGVSEGSARFGDQTCPATAALNSFQRFVVWKHRSESLAGKRLQPAPSGDPFVVAEDISSSPQFCPEAFSGNKGEIVVWLGSTGLHARRYEDGVPGDVVDVDSDPTGLERRPSGAGNGAVNVIAWAESTEDGEPPSIINARLFNDQLDPLGDSFEVAFGQSSFDAQVAVSGSIFVVWERSTGWHESPNVFLKVLEQDGTPITTEILVNQTVAGLQWQAAVGAALQPGFEHMAVVAWNENFDRVLMRRFGADGGFLSDEIEVAEGSDIGDVDVAVQFDDFLIVWRSAKDVWARRYQGDGTPLAEPFQLNQFALQVQRHPSVSADGFGNYFVAWQSDLQDGSGTGIFGLEITTPFAFPPTPPPATDLAGAGFSFGTRALPSITLGSESVGASPSHQLDFDLSAGDLELYRAVWAYPAEFQFNGFLAIGPPGTAIGSYAFDTDGDGVADQSADVVSESDHRAFIDLDGDGQATANPPLLQWGASGFAVFASLGGDLDPGTLLVPMSGRMTIELFPGILVNPLTAGSWPVEVVLTSVDPDTDDADDFQGESPLEFACQHQLFTVEAIEQDPIFADGFESGDTGAWG